MKNRSRYIFVSLIFILAVTGKISAQNNNDREEDDIYYSGHSNNNTAPDNNTYRSDSTSKQSNTTANHYYDPYYNQHYLGGYYDPYYGGFYPYISFYPYRWHFWLFNGWFHPGYWDCGHYYYGRRDFAGRGQHRNGNNFGGHRESAQHNRGTVGGSMPNSAGSSGYSHHPFAVRNRGNENMVGNKSQFSPSRGHAGTFNSRPGSARGGFGSIGRGGFSSGS